MAPNTGYLAELEFEPRSAFLQSTQTFSESGGECVNQLCCITKNPKISMVYNTHTFLALVDVCASAGLCSVYLLILCLRNMPILVAEDFPLNPLKTLSWM